jgi:hypothetical protein
VTLGSGLWQGSDHEIEGIARHVGCRVGIDPVGRPNGGILQVNWLYEVIEGAKMPGHGSRDMPI